MLKILKLLVPPSKKVKHTFHTSGGGSFSQNYPTFVQYVWKFHILKTDLVAFFTVSSAWLYIAVVNKNANRLFTDASSVVIYEVVLLPFSWGERVLLLYMPQETDDMNLSAQFLQDVRLHGMTTQRSSLARKKLIFFFEWEVHNWSLRCQILGLSSKHYYV